MDFGLNVRGDREALRAFDRLSALGQASVLSEAATAGADPLVRAAKGKAPDAVIREGIRLINIEVNGRGKVTAKVGLPGGKKPWFYGLFIERGTGPRVQKKTGRRTGSMPAKPFLRPAFESAKGQAQDEFGKHMRTRLLQVARDGGL